MITPKWPVVNNIKAATICRNDAINRELSGISLPDKVLWLNQVHGIDNCNINAQTKSYVDQFYDYYTLHQQNTISEDYRAKLFKADASYTILKNIACAIKTADCLPILVSDQAGTWVSAIHAGWRGLLAGIVTKTIQSYPGDPRNLLVWIGPAICQEHFIVGDEVKELFEKNMFDVAAFEQSSSLSKWHANLNALAIQALAKTGINNIYTSNYCTYCEPELFFSYRRDGDNTGRLITLIWKT